MISIMYYVLCPNCDAQVEVLPNAIGPVRYDLWNVNWCDQCGVSFDYDDEVMIENLPTAPEVQA